MFINNIKRFFLEIAYDGTAYHGWQIQPNAISVQEKLNQALHTFLREEVETIGAGRTDTGVHAKQLYVHFDMRFGFLFCTSKFLTHKRYSLREKTIQVPVKEFRSVAKQSVRLRLYINMDQFTGRLPDLYEHIQHIENILSSLPEDRFQVLLVMPEAIG